MRVTSAPLLFAACATLAACDGKPQEALTAPPTDAAFVMDPEELRVDGLDRHPLPADPDELRAAIARHDPRRPEGASVTVDVTVDPAGRVTAVRPVPRSAGTQPALVLQEKDGSQRTVRPGAEDPGGAAAAEAALREVRFTPALRNGRAVAHTFRMTLTFAPGAPGERR